MNAGDGFLTVGGAFMLAAVGLLAGTALERRHLRQLRERGIRVADLVVEFKRVRFGDAYELRPLLRFRTVDGQDVETISRRSPWSSHRSGSSRPGRQRDL